MKPLYLLTSLLSLFLVGCSLVPKQKAGSDALAEAICRYDKKIDYKSDDFRMCVDNETR